MLKRLLALLGTGILLLAAPFANAQPLSADHWTPKTLAYAEKVESTPGWVTVLEYHAIQAAVPGDPWVVTPQAFAQQMEAIANSKRPVLTVAELAADLERQAMPRGAIVITFDDGYKSVYQNAFPIMQHLGLKGTCFIIGVDAYTPDVGFGHMTIPEMQTMARAGWDFESHTFDLHPPDPIIAANAPVWFLAQDLADEEALLRLVGTKNPVAFAYPGDFISATELSVIKKTYLLAFGGETRGKGWGTSVYNWPRFVVTPRTTPEEILAARLP